jgi:hypothetical protein
MSCAFIFGFFFVFVFLFFVFFFRQRVAYAPAHNGMVVRTVSRQSMPCPGAKSDIGTVSVIDVSAAFATADVKPARPMVSCPLVAILPD